jgi:starch-binding outer membrane protein, SusD/RagB family
MNMKQKYIGTLAIAGAIVLGITGCEKKLELAPFNAFTDESVFTTPERVNLAINGVYDAAQSGFFGGAIDRGYPFGAANVQQGDNRGEDVVNLAAFYQITYQGTYNPTTANNVWYFNSTYRLINFANVAIDGVTKAGDGGIISQEVATTAVAEMRFLRALSHHELVVFFARPFLDGNGDKLGVPYRDFPVNSGSAVDAVRTDARPTVAQTYAKILEDCDYAIANLPIQQSIVANRKIRAERGAAIALKMKVLMHMGRFQDAKAEGDKLVPATVNPASPASVVSPIGGYALTATPQAAFLANSLSTENIFSIKNDALDNPGVNAALPAMYGAASLGGRGLVALSPIVWNRTEWLEGDARRTNLYVMGANAFTRQSIFTTKYPDYVQRGSNNPIFRYAEVLLMLAECEARLAGGVSQRAVDLLNVVRNRSIPDPANNQFTTSSFANQTALLQTILWERRFEFGLEGKRWMDISRMSNDPVTALRIPGIPAKLANGSDGAAIYGIGVALPTNLQPAIPYADFRFVWPFPADEIVQNPIIVQNPGY